LQVCHLQLLESACNASLDFWQNTFVVSCTNCQSSQSMGICLKVVLFLFVVNVILKQSSQDTN
jgi:hypothetical protein